MVEILHREFVYIYYFLSVQLGFIAPYWALGIVLGSLVSVFGKSGIHRLFLKLNRSRLGMYGIIPASLLGIASLLCMYGTIPIAASFSARGMRDDWLAAFMMSSVLLNPQLLLYSAALGRQMLAFRFIFSFLGGVTAGLLVAVFFNGGSFFSFAELQERTTRDTHPNLFIRLLLNIWRNIKATGPYFLLGIGLTALYQRYVPEESVVKLFGRGNRGFGILMASAVGIPLYVCGGGTIPLLYEWLHGGMGAGSAVAFMISGPATKLTNLGALKIVLKLSRFWLYVGFVIILAVAAGLTADLTGQFVTGAHSD